MTIFPPPVAVVTAAISAPPINGQGVTTPVRGNAEHGVQTHVATKHSLVFVDLGGVQRYDGLRPPRNRGARNRNVTSSPR
jgi:hypothetical protein